MRKHRTWIMLLAASLLTVFLIIVSWFFFLFTSTITNKQGITYLVRPGASIQLVINDLYKQKIIFHPFMFECQVAMRGATHHLKAGEYLFLYGASPYHILSQLISGKGQVHHPFTIVEGWNFKQIETALSHETFLRHTIDHLTEKEIMTRLGKPELKAEGMFYPETYHYTLDSSDLDLLKRAFKLMQKKLDASWEKREADLPYQTSYDALIAASLIEKEAFLKQERPIIAGVIINRLKHNMLLQIDPTVIYGVAERYTGKLHKEDLLDNNPYNTYIHRGLPPTPIAMPSYDSIEAVLHPNANEYFYYVAKGDGSHFFSKSLVEHREAINAAKKIKSTKQQNNSVTHNTTGNTLSAGK